MNVVIRGTTVMIQTLINKEDYDKFKDYDVFTVRNEEGDATYRIAMGPESNITKFCLVCDGTYQGKLSASTIVPVEDREDFIKWLQPRLLLLKEAQATILNQIDEMDTRLSGLDDVIVIED